MKGPYNDIEYFHPEILAFIMECLWGYGELKYRKLKQSINILTTYKWQKKKNFLIPENLKHILNLRHCCSSSSSAECKTSEIIPGYSINLKIVLSRYETPEKSAKCGINLSEWWRKEYFLKELLILSCRSIMCGEKIHYICCFLSVFWITFQIFFPPLSSFI